MISLELAKQYLIGLKRSSPLNFTIPLIAGMLGIAIFLRKKIGM